MTGRRASPDSPGKRSRGPLPSAATPAAVAGDCVETFLQELDSSIARETFHPGSALKELLDRSFNGDGLFRRDPWRTHALLPAFERLKKLRPPEEWPPEVRELAAKVYKAARELWTPGGFLFEAGKPDGSPKRGRKPASLPNPDPKAKEPALGLQSDDGEVAILRTGRGGRAAALGVDCHRQAIGLDLRMGERTVLRGEWNTRIRADQRAVDMPSEWQAVCWFSDADGQYLELRRLAGGGLILERQLYLSRRLPVLLLVDTLKSPLSELLEISWELPFHEVEQMRGVFPTRAQEFSASPIPMRLLPIGAPASPLDPATGGVSLSDGGIAVTGTARGTRLVLPLVIAWGPAAEGAQEPWRSLAITNDRRPVGQEEAVAYRVPIAGRQMVYFRALGRAMRCAFLGHQTFHECVLGEFGRGGNLNTWVVIEGSYDEP